MKLCHTEYFRREIVLQIDRCTIVMNMPMIHFGYELHFENEHITDSNILFSLLLSITNYAYNNNDNNSPLLGTLLYMFILIIKKIYKYNTYIYTRTQIHRYIPYTQNIICSNNIKNKINKNKNKIEFLCLNYTSIKTY